MSNKTSLHLKRLSAKAFTNHSVLNFIGQKRNNWMRNRYLTHGSVEPIRKIFERQRKRLQKEKYSVDACGDGLEALEAGEKTKMKNSVLWINRPLYI